MNSRLPFSALQAATALFLVTVAAAYAGLTPLGHWEDEFQTFPLFLEHGWKALWYRTIHWSPRPVSEAILFAYAQLAMRAGADLIPYVLALLWLGLASSAVVVPCVFRRRFSSSAEWFGTLVLALGLFCLFLLGHPVAEFFYWPQSTVAYVPALAGLVVALWLVVIAGLETPGARRALAASLTVAALSAEAAAIYVLILCALTASMVLVRRRPPQPGPESQWSGIARTLLWPFLAAAMVMAVAAFARVGNNGEVFGDPAIAHHLVRSVAAAGAVFVRELLFASPERPTAGSLALGIAAKAAFFVATLLMLRPFARTCAAPQNRARLVALFAAACLATIFATIWAAYYQFGLVCCQRHGTFRQALAYLAVFSLGAVAAFSRPDGTLAAGVGRLRLDAFGWLLVATLPLALASAGDVLHDYRTFDQRWQLAHRNWRVGRAAGDRFVYLTIDPGRIVGGLGIPSGTYTAHGDAPGTIRGMVQFFNKKEITFRNYLERPPEPEVRPPFERQVEDQPPPRCHLDFVNGQPYTGGEFVRRRADGRLMLQGWTAPHASIAVSEVRTWMVVNSPASGRDYYQAPMERRPDVVEALQRPELIDSGFRITFDSDQVPEGSTIGFLSVSGRDAYRCGFSVKPR